MIFDIPHIGEIEITTSSKVVRNFTTEQLVNYVKNESSRISSDFIEMRGDVFRHHPIIANSFCYMGRRFTAETDSISGSIKYTISPDIKRFHRFRNLRNEHIHYIFYKTILFNLFGIMQCIAGYHVYHGALLESDKGLIFLTGQPHSGKSTLCLALRKKGFKVLTDNFALFNGKQFFSLALPVRIENPIDDLRHLQQQGHDYYQYNICVTQKIATKPSKIVLIEISDKNEVINLSAEMAMHMLAHCNIFAPEIRDANLALKPRFFTDNINGTSNIEYLLIKCRLGELLFAEETLRAN